jgi:Icc protein
MNERARSLTVLQITDTHLHAATDSQLRGVRTYDTFCRVVDHALNKSGRSVDLIVVTGDIVQDESRAGYELFRDSLATFNLPVFCIPGNHDDPVLIDELLGRSPFQAGGEARFANWSIVFLSTFLLGEDAGGLGEQRLKGLDRALQAHDDQHVLVCMHHHAIPMGSRWLDGVALRDAPDFLQLIDRHRNVRAVLYGHVHQESDRERNGVRHLSTPSTCSQFQPASEFFALDDSPPGYRWLELRPDGSIRTEVQWVDWD